MEKRASTIPTDRLSSLHDSILLQILSFLPTKEAIKTSILSKRWRHTWTLTPALHFALASPADVDFVDRVLAHHASSSITTFCVKSDHILDGRRVCNWVDYAVSRKVRNLKINLSSFTETQILGCLYPCQSLESLGLWALLRQPLPLPDPSAPCFSNLRTLKLRLAFEFSGDSLARLISSCCKLEVLCLTATFFEVLEISAPKVRVLELGLVRCSELWVSCPKLEYFLLLVKEPVRDFRGEMPSLFRADVKLPSSSQSNVFWTQLSVGGGGLRERREEGGRRRWLRE